MSTQDISSFLADIKKLKEQADAQSQDNSRFAIASEKLGELLNATEELEDGSTNISNAEQPQRLTEWKPNAVEDTLVESTKEVVVDDANEAPKNENVSEGNALTSALTSTVNKTQDEDIQNDSIVSGASIVAAATAGVAALATIDTLSKTDETNEVKVENGADSDLVVSEGIVEKDVTTENGVHVDGGLAPKLNIAEQAAAQAKTNAGQFENRDYEADHVKVQPSADDDAPVKEILTSVSQGKNEDKTAQIAATAAATVLAGSSLVDTAALAGEEVSVAEQPVVDVESGIEKEADVEIPEPSVMETNSAKIEEAGVTKLTDNEVDFVEAASMPTEGSLEDQDVVNPDVNMAEHDPLISIAGAATVIGGISAVTLSAKDDGLNASAASEGEAHAEDIIAISDPQPGDDVRQNLVSEDLSGVEPELEFSQELPENALSSSAVEASVLTQAATSIEKDSVHSILTKPTPISESIQGQAEHEIDISHINANAEAEVNDEAPSLEEAAAEIVPEAPAIAEVAAVSPVVEAPSLEEAAAEIIPESPAISEVASVSPVVEVPSLEEAAAEIIPEVPTVTEVAGISPVVEAPSLEEAAAEIIPESPAVTEVATVSPVVEAPSLEEVAAEIVPESPAIAEVAAVSPVVEVPSLEEAAAEIIPESPAIAEVAAVSPVVEAPSLEEAAAEIVPEAPTIAEVAAVSPVVEAPSLEEAAAEIVPEGPTIAEVAAVSPVVETPSLEEAAAEIVPESPVISSVPVPSLETPPVAAPMIATPNVPTMAHIPLVSPEVGESVLVQPNENSAGADSAIFTAQSHSIPTAQQDGVQASDLAINSEKVILSGDDIKYQTENGVKKRGFFARLFLKNKE